MKQYYSLLESGANGAIGDVFKQVGIDITSGKSVKYLIDNTYSHIDLLCANTKNMGHIK